MENNSIPSLISLCFFFFFFSFCWWWYPSCFFFLGYPFSLFIWILYFTWTLIWASSSSLPSSNPAVPGEYREHLSLCHRQVLFPDTLRKFLCTFLNVPPFPLSSILVFNGTRYLTKSQHTHWQRG